jgi:hypothetical protein
MRRLSGHLTLGGSVPCCVITLALFTVASPGLGENLLVNGGFESGNVGFVSEYVYSYDMNAYGEGKYYVGSNPRDHNPQFFDMGAEEGLLMMIVNGALQPGLVVWRESGIAVQPYTTYGFSAWVAEVSGVGSLATVQVSINGASLGTMIPTSYGDWLEYHFTWNSGADTSADITLVDLNTDWNGNDFALDNMVLQEEEPTGTSLTTWGRIRGLYR